MITIILDFTSGEIFTFSHELMQVEDIEEIITQKYNFSLNNIEWMSVKNFKINNLDIGIIGE